MRHVRLGRHVILIGHKGHPEVIGTMGQLEAGEVTLIETVEDVARFVPKDADQLGFVTQTTLSVDDTQDVIKAMQEKFPKIQAPAAESICYATTNRQEAVKQAAENCDHFIIVGAPNSSNSKRLVEVARRAGAKKSLLVQRASEINWDEFDGVRTLGISAGASAPEVIVDEIIDAFRQRFNVKIELAEMVKESENFLVNRELRDVELTASDMAFVNGQ